MIISASRRTDIPAFYAEWFMNRIRAGYCLVPNPFNAAQVSRIPLKPGDVDCIVFWTRNPRPLMGSLAELDGAGIPYYFQFTIMDNPRDLDPKCPPAAEAVRTFRELSLLAGADRVVWRYDPVVVSDRTGAGFHIEKFRQIAAELRGYTKRVVISIVDRYKPAVGRLKELERAGWRFADGVERRLEEFVPDMVETAGRYGMEIVSCAEPVDLTQYGVRAGSCIDGELIAGIAGRTATFRKDRNQRDACGCVVSRDIGMYDSCPCNCLYCYATRSTGAVERNLARHDPGSPMLIG